MATTKKSAAKKNAAKKSAAKKSAARKPAARKPAARRLAAKTDAISMLIADHKKVQKAFKDFEKLKEGSSKRGRSDIVRQTCTDLTIHATIEEEIFYPAVRQAIKDTDLMDEATVEHAGAKELIAQLEGMQPGDDLYDAKFTVLGENVNHHIKEEQNEMFPKVRKTKLDLNALGEQLAQRKGELQSQMLPGDGDNAEKSRMESQRDRAPTAQQY
jgi:hemerythrin superfamily protein